MRQRVMIAIGLACNPKLLIADEPTTALDVTIQAQILELMKDLSRRLGIALIIITHNLGIVARYADRVNVMYAARLVESGTAERVFAQPAASLYASGCWLGAAARPAARRQARDHRRRCRPTCCDPPPGCRFAPRCRFAHRGVRTTMPPLVEVEPGHLVGLHRATEIDALEHRWCAPPSAARPRRTASRRRRRAAPRHRARSSKFFAGRRRASCAARASSCARSTTCRFDVMPRRDARAGRRVGLRQVHARPPGAAPRRADRRRDPLRGRRPRARSSRAEMTACASKMQVIFQDPYSSLNPRMTVGQIIGEPMRVHELVPKPQGRARARRRAAATRSACSPTWR